MADFAEPDWEKRLRELGWLTGPPDEFLGRRWRQTITAYQQFHGLPETGKLDGPTKRSLAEPMVCGHPDVMGMTADVPPRWPMSDLTWHLAEDAQFGSLSKLDVMTCLVWAWQQWVNCCGITATYTEDATAANVLILTGDVDGRWNVLAFSQMPEITSSLQRTMKFDATEPWCVAAKPSKYQVDLARVACHEVAHCLGIGHLDSGNLLQPKYDINIRAPQAGDIGEAVARYGPPKAVAPGKVHP